MNEHKNLTHESLQAEMDEWAGRVKNASGWAAAKAAANECAIIAAKARRAGFKIKNPHPTQKEW